MSSIVQEKTQSDTLHLIPVIMHLIAFRKALLNHRLKDVCKNEVFWRGRRLQICRSKSTAPKNYIDYESARRSYNPQVPPYYNFAKDVLELWETKEKVLTYGSNIYVNLLCD